MPTKDQIERSSERLNKLEGATAMYKNLYQDMSEYAPGEMWTTLEVLSWLKAQFNQIQNVNDNGGASDDE